MWTRPFNTIITCLCFLIYSSALPRSKDYRPMNSEYVPGESNSGSNLAKEPSCEELRAMWRFSKRQSRAAEITNEIPTYRDPFAYNVWDEYARPRSAGRGSRFRKPPIYGKIVHSASHGRLLDNYPERIRAFEEVARLFSTSMQPTSGVPRRKGATSFRLGGGGSPIIHSQSGSFQHLKELIRNERARELQERRMQEEAQRNAMKERYQYGRVNDHAPSIVDNTLVDKQPTAQSKGLVAFPDILIPPSKYLEDYVVPAQYLSTQKYKQKYPEANSILGVLSQWA